MEETEIKTKLDVQQHNEEKDEKMIKLDEPIQINFKCFNCLLEEKCDFYGKQPPFAKKINFNENCFIMRDPFSPYVPSSKSNLEHFIVIGGNCMVCDKIVCCSIECSFFYYKTFCLNCAKNNINDFPLEIQSKIRKVINCIENF